MVDKQAELYTLQIGGKKAVFHLKKEARRLVMLIIVLKSTEL